MAELVCPKCGFKVRKSRTRNFYEKILKSFGSRPYRCRDKKCNWRGLMRKRSLIEFLFYAKSIYWRRIVIVITFLIGIFLAFIIFQYVIFYFI